MKNKSIIAILVILIVGLGLVVGVALLTENKRNENQVSMYEQTYKDMFGSNVTAEPVDTSEALTLKNFFLGSEQNEDIKSVLEIKDGSTSVGFLYIVEGTNTYGMMRLAVAVKNNDIAKVKVLEFVQTMDEQASIDRIENHDFLDESFVGVTYTIRLVDQLLTSVADHAGFEYSKGEPVEKLPYETWFGKNYVASDVAFDSPEAILQSIQAIHVEDALSGYVFKVTDTGEYYDDYNEQVKSGAITIEVITDTTGNIMGYVVPREAYGHTASYMTKVNAVMDLYVGNALKAIDDLTDGQAGVTEKTPGSGGLAREMINKLSAGIQTFEFALPYSQWFDGTYEVTDLSEIVDDKIIKAEVLKDGETVVGYVYHVKDKGTYNTYSDIKEGEITVVVATDKDGLIVGVDLPKGSYGHTLAPATYYTEAVSFLEGYKNTNIKDANQYDGETGATQSALGSRSLVKAIVEYLSDKLGGNA